MNCFKCSCTFSYVFELVKHLRNDHFLKDNDILHCKEDQCFRVFNNFNSFRKHLNGHGVKNSRENKNLLINDQEFKKFAANNSFSPKKINATYVGNTDESNFDILVQLDDFKKYIRNFVLGMYNNSMERRFSSVWCHTTYSFVSK